MEKSKAIRKSIGVNDGYVVIADKAALHKYVSSQDLVQQDSWTLLTEFENSALDCLVVIQDQLVRDISSTVPQTTLENISKKLQLNSVTIAMVESGHLPGSPEGSEANVGNVVDRTVKIPSDGVGRGFSRVDQEMLKKSHADYLEEAKPASTKKSTKAATTLYDSVMGEVGLSKLESTKVEDLPANINTMIRVLRKPSKNPEEPAGYYNASSLETYFQSLARAVKELFTVDIKTDVRFHQCRETLKVKKQESAANAEVAGKNAKKSIPAKCLAKAYALGKLGTSNPQALCATVALAAMGGWGCRLKEEPYNITNGDLVYGPEIEVGIPEYIKLKERLTKTMRGARREPRELDKTLYADNERPDQCQVRAVLELQRRKTEEQLAPDAPLFWTCRQLRGDPQEYQFWFTSVRMGVHKIGSLIPDQLKAAGVDVKGLAIAGYSGRKTTLQGGLEAGVPGPYLAKVAGQKAYSSTGSYIQHENASAKAMSLVIARRAHGDDTVKFDDVLEKIKSNEKKEISALTSDSRRKSESDAKIKPDSGAGTSQEKRKRDSESTSNLENPVAAQTVAAPTVADYSQSTQGVVWQKSLSMSLPPCGGQMSMYRMPPPQMYGPHTVYNSPQLPGYHFPPTPGYDLPPPLGFNLAPPYHLPQPSPSYFPPPEQVPHCQYQLPQMQIPHGHNQHQITPQPFYQHQITHQSTGQMQRSFNPYGHQHQKTSVPYQMVPQPSGHYQMTPQPSEHDQMAQKYSGQYQIAPRQYQVAPPSSDQYQRAPQSLDQFQMTHSIGQPPKDSQSSVQYQMTPQSPDHDQYQIPNHPTSSSGQNQMTIQFPAQPKKPQIPFTPSGPSRNVLPAPANEKDVEPGRKREETTPAAKERDVAPGWRSLTAQEKESKTSASEELTAPGNTDTTSPQGSEEKQKENNRVAKLGSKTPTNREPLAEVKNARYIAKK